MEEKKNNELLPGGPERIPLVPHSHTKFRFFAVFLICCAILIAAFAVSAVLMRGNGEDFFRGLGSFWKNDDGQTDDPNATQDSTVDQEKQPSLEAPTQPSDPIPEGAIRIVSKDLSSLALGSSYIHNETPYSFTVADLLTRPLLKLKVSDAPQVLILHTHTSESYLPRLQDYINGAPGDSTYSKDASQNVLAVGEALCKSLNQKGITAIHCTVMHDEPTLNGSYERSSETVREYLKLYPTIQYVIDLHRDAVLTQNGEYVRTVTQLGERSVAQVMAVVGSDCNGTTHSRWQENLALALQLRQTLNQKCPTLCRPASLRKASYNQELAPYFLLLEIGSGANTVEEAIYTAGIVGEALAELIQES
jgi:stage II sporulation protein P